MFQTLTLGLNEHLKREAEDQNAFQVPGRGYPWGVNTDKNWELFKKLAKNQSKTEELLNDLWKTYGNFSYDNCRDNIMKPLKDEAEHLNEKCSEVDSDDSACIDYAKKLQDRSMHYMFLHVNILCHQVYILGITWIEYSMACKEYFGELCHICFINNHRIVK